MDPPASRRNEARLLIATEEGSHVLRERTEQLLRHEGEGCLQDRVHFGADHESSGLPILFTYGTCWTSRCRRRAAARPNGVCGPPSPTPPGAVRRAGVGRLQPSPPPRPRVHVARCRLPQPWPRT